MPASSPMLDSPWTSPFLTGWKGDFCPSLSTLQVLSLSLSSPGTLFPLKQDWNAPAGPRKYTGSEMQNTWLEFCKHIHVSHFHLHSDFKHSKIIHWYLNTWSNLPCPLQPMCESHLGLRHHHSLLLCNHSHRIHPGFNSVTSPISIQSPWTGHSLTNLHIFCSLLHFIQNSVFCAFKIQMTINCVIVNKFSRLT